MPNYILNPDHVKIIDLWNENALFFHAATLQIYPLNNKEIIHFLKSYAKNGYEITKTSYAKKDFFRLYNFITNKIRENPKLETFPILDLEKENFDVIILPISASCNLCCPYCFAQTEGGFHFKNFTKQNVIEIISSIIDKRADLSKPLTIIFFGGEPLLNLEVIKFAITYIKDNYPQHTVYYSITTNGTILNKEIIEIFKENNFSVLISLDGYENEFNLRRFHNGKSSVNKVVNNINLLKEYNIGMEIRATLVNNNPYIVKTFNFFENLAVPFNIVFAYASANKNHHYADYNETTMALIKQQFDDLLYYYINKLKKGEFIYNKLFADITQIFRFRINRQLICSAGINFFTITANGDIFSCAHLMNDPQYKIGNISTGIDNKSNYIPLFIEDIEDCKGCWAKYLCLGGCFSQKITVGGSNRSSKEKYECELEKLKWTFYMKLYYSVMDMDSKFFVQSSAQTLKC